VLQVDAQLVAADSGPAAAHRRIGGRCGADSVFEDNAEACLSAGKQQRTCLPAGRRRDSRRSAERSPGSHARGREFCAKLMRELSTDYYSLSIVSIGYHSNRGIRMPGRIVALLPLGLCRAPWVRWCESPGQPGPPGDAANDPPNLSFC
jgi:hypothetical protein